MKTIIHITCDYPDPLEPKKTRAIINLIESTPGFRHVVYSLNRVNFKTGIAAFEFARERIAVAYGAPPRGLFLATFLKHVSDWIIEDIRKRKLSVDAIHAHKFAIEGLVASELAEIFQQPLLCSFHGDTDLKVTTVRFDLRPKWNRILAKASALLPCTPWVLQELGKILQIDHAKETLMPLMTMNEDFHKPQVSGRRLVSILHFDSFVRKNLATLIPAIVEVAKAHPDIALDIYGGGSPGSFLAVTEIIRKSGANQFVTLKGQMPNDKVPGVLNGYAGFALPSHRESFGMVFIESLFSGVPVLYSKKWGIDGFFPAERIGYACDPREFGDVVTGIHHLLNNQVPLKASIETLQSSGALALFRPGNVVTVYRKVLESV